MNAHPGGSRRVGVGIVGAGARMRRVLGLLLAESDAVSVVAVCDPDDRSVASARSTFGPGFRVCRDYADLLADPAVEWVFIGSWNCFHAEQLVAAFRAGKHVFCEKPLATSTADVPEIRRAWTESGRTFAFGLVLRYAPLYQEVRRRLERGLIGNIISFEFNETLAPEHGGYIHGDWRRLRRQAGTLLLEKCCHDLDLAIWFSGRLPTRAASFGGLNFFTPAEARQVERVGPDAQGRTAFRTWPNPIGVDPFGGGQDIFDNQVAILEFAGGARATFHLNCSAAIPERRFYLLGTEGTLRADARTGTIEVRRIGHNEPTESLKLPDSDGHSGADEVMARQLAHTLVEGRPPAAGMNEAVQSLVACTGIDRAADQGAVVDLTADWNRLGFDPLRPTLAALPPRIPST